MKFNQGNFKVHHLGRNKSKHQDRMGANQLENSFEEKDVPLLADKDDQKSVKWLCGNGSQKRALGLFSLEKRRLRGILAMCKHMACGERERQTQILLKGMQ